MDKWCVLELMGHVRTAGRVSEEEHFGAKVGRIDIPQDDGSFVTQLFGGGSIYRLTYVDEATARAVALASAQAPIHSWEMPKMLPPVKVEVVEEAEAGWFPDAAERAAQEAEDKGKQPIRDWRYHNEGSDA